MIGRLFLHAGHDAAAIGAAGGGSPLYDVAPGHVGAVAALVALGVGAWLVRARAAAGDPWAVGLSDAFRRQHPLHRFLVALLLVSAAIHVGLALGHGGPLLRLLFAGEAIALAVVLRRMAQGQSWRGWAAAVLLGSIGAYWAALLGGEPPDQVGMATKLAELTALAIVLRPVSGRRLRAVLATGAVIVLVVLTDVAAWAGSFAAAGAGHHGPGSIATPGTVLPTLEDRTASAAERAAADELYVATVAAIARYADPMVAAADGYDVSGLAGLDFHAANEVHEHDGHVLDPQRPETLVYASTPRGAVLLGAMFVMPDLHASGPAVGGPLTVWHAHEQICFSLTPPALTGILSPLGSCPVGSIDLPITPEMIHVWTVPGAPDRFGDLDPVWRALYVAAAAS